MEITINQLAEELGGTVFELAALAPDDIDLAERDAQGHYLRPRPGAGDDLVRADVADMIREAWRVYDMD